MDKESRIGYLLSQYVMGKLTPDEMEELATWRAENDANESFFLDATSRKSLKEGIKAATGYNPSLVRQKLYHSLGLSGSPRRSGYYIRWIAAASIIGIVAWGALQFLIGNNKELNGIATVAKTEKTTLAPGRSRAVLTLADGRQVDLGTAGNGLVAKQSGSLVKKLDSGQLLYAASTSASQVTEGNGPTSEYNLLVTPKAGQFRVTLGDGTKVWLNNASTLKYPTAFSGNKRMVTLTGEAYFDVATDENRPFLVQTATGQSVEVLGTAFNVSAYPDEQTEKTTLVEGKVRVKAGVESEVLSVGNQAIINTSGKSQIRVEKVDVGSIIAWKDGFFNFINADLNSVFRQLSRWYDLDYRFEGKVPNVRWQGEISRDLSFD